MIGSSEREPLLLGKPASFILDHLCAHHSIPRDKCVVVGACLGAQAGAGAAGAGSSGSAVSKRNVGVGPTCGITINARAYVYACPLVHGRLLCCYVSMNYIIPFLTGDRLDTDILWGIQNGAGTCCVLTGAWHGVLHPRVRAAMHAVHSSRNIEASMYGNSEPRADRWQQHRCTGPYMLQSLSSQLS